MLPIAHAPPGDWPAALDLALRQTPPGLRPTRVANVLALLATGELHPDCLLVARDGQDIVGVQVAIPLAGASGLFWLPQVRARTDEGRLTDDLVHSALAWLGGLGIKIAQAILEPGQLGQANPLLRNGFNHLTSLQYYRHYFHPPSLFSPGADASRLAALRLEPFRPDDPGLFHQTLPRTYEGTRDCPELNDRRTVEEIILGHQAQGRFRPERWRLAFLNEQPAGVVLATEMFDDLGWDLSYVGVVPAMRRRGLGRALTAWALHAAHEAGAEQMILAVDVRNEPALRMYESMGFQPTERREVLLTFV